MSPAKTHRIDLIEQLRGLAALAVAWFHLTNGYVDWVVRTGSYGWLGVEVFFVISGVVIPLSLAADWQQRGTLALPQFLLRRIVRIEPPYLISVLLVVALNLLAMRVPGFQGKAQAYPPEQILLHAAYLIPLSSYGWLQPVYWTLAYEFAFYLTVALLIGALASTRHWQISGVMAVVLVLIGVRWVSPLLALFIMGCVVFRSWAGLMSSRFAGLGLLACAAVMILMGAIEQCVVGVLTAVALLAQRQLAPLAARVSMLSGIGTISFSLYLLHVPIGGKIVNLGQRWLTSPLEHLLLSAAALAGSLMAAYFFWRWVECPCIAASRRMGYAWRHRPALPRRN